jgi:hypothetical protein
MGDDVAVCSEGYRSEATHVFMTAQGGAWKRRKENVHVRLGGQVLQCDATDINGKATVSSGEHGGSN